MLLQFKIKNFLSFKEETTLEMYASNPDKAMLENTIDLKGKEKNNLVKQIAIYGPNASGKSNFIEAFSLLRNIIWGDLWIEEFSRLNFANESSKNEPTVFEIQFYAIDKNKYNYRVSFLKNVILDEYLHKKENDKYELIISRVYNKKNKKYIIKHNEKYDTNLNNFSEFTHQKNSILSLLKNFENDIFYSVISSFLGVMVITNDDKVCQKFNYVSSYRYFRNRGLDDSRTLDKCIRKMITHLDLGISNFSLKEVNKEKELMFSYKGLDDELFSKENSKGTNKLFEMAYSICHVLITGGILLIDELDSNIHPLVAKKIVELFSSEQNESNAQLIFTTHNPLFLDDILRRDQIWFCEKDDNAVSHLYPLKSFKMRNDAVISKRYLSGAFGAVPFIPSTWMNSKDDAQEIIEE